MAKAKVLFIDDEPIILEIVKEQFESAHYEIKLFNNAILAYDFLKNNKFDIIISDFNMPNFTGFEFVSKVRSDLQLETPVIFLTGNHQLSIEEAKRLNILKIFYKPVDLDDIVLFIDKYLTDKSSVS